MNLSIIIVNYNTKELLRQCLESIINQSPTTEIIVVDNGSTDGSVQEIKDQISKIKNKTQNLKLILNTSNLGFSMAVNQGIKISEGKTILLLNSDARIKKDAIKNLLDFEQKVGPAIIGARMLNPDGTVQGSCFNLPTVKRAILEFWLGKKNYFSKYVPLGNEPVEVEAVSGGAMLISKGVIDKIGLLDERYFMYFEDLDYCRRVSKAGLKVYYLPNAEIYHYHGASGEKIPYKVNHWLIESSKIYHGIFKYWIITFVIWLKQKC